MNVTLPGQQLQKSPVNSEARFAFIYSNPITVTDAVSIKSK